MELPPRAAVAVEQEPDFVYLVGYHGTSTKNAVSILEKGTFQYKDMDGQYYDYGRRRRSRLPKTVFGQGFYFNSQYEVAQSYSTPSFLGGRGAILRAIIRVQRKRVQVVRKLPPWGEPPTAIGSEAMGMDSNEAWKGLEGKDVLFAVPDHTRWDENYEIVLKPEFGAVDPKGRLKTPATMIVYLENVTPTKFLSCIFCRQRAKGAAGWSRIFPDEKDPRRDWCATNVAEILGRDEEEGEDGSAGVGSASSSGGGGNVFRQLMDMTGSIWPVDHYRARPHRRHRYRTRPHQRRPQ